MKRWGLASTRTGSPRIYSLFVTLADRKKNIYDQDLLGIVREFNTAVFAA